MVLLGVLGPKSATPPGLLANELRAPLGGECHGRVQRPRGDRDPSLPQDSTRATLVYRPQPGGRRRLPEHNGSARDAVGGGEQKG